MSNYIFKNLGKFYKRKQWYNFRCPYHRGSSLNFGVNFVSGVCSCFACGKSIKIYELIRDLKEGIVEGFYDYSPAEIPTNGQIYGEDVSSLSGSIYKDKLEECNRYFTNNYTHIKDYPESIHSGKIRDYLLNRGVDIDKFDVGVLNGLETRCTFPIRLNGLVITYQARSISKSPKLKTINPNIDYGWANKNKVLWGYDQIKDNSTVIITEGIFDAISCIQATGIDTVPLLGSNISIEQIRLLKRKAGNIIVFLDSEARRSALDVCERLSDNGIICYYVKYTDHEGGEVDPNDLPHECIRKYIDNSVEYDLFDKQLYDLDFANS
jgi:hypothetical protein